MHKLDTFFNPRSIAVVGASEEKGKVGNVIAKNITTLGYAGEVFFVNPKHSEMLGKRCYSSLTEIGREIDLVIIAVPAKFVSEIISASVSHAKNFVVISAGFSEIGDEGRQREEDIKKIAESEGLNILGPNCLGFIIPSLNLNASFAGGMPEAGNISFVSQSGALAVAIMDIARSENFKFSSIISVGNKMQVDEAMLLEHLGTDKKTKVIGLYLESVKNAPAFLQAAENVSRKKPIVILKAGKTEKSQKAISSHTGALAGSDETMSALFEKAGVIRAENLEEFLKLLSLISLTDPPQNNKVAVITNAGGPGVLTTDSFGGKDLELAELSAETKSELRKILPEESSVENPIDLLGDAMEDRYKNTLEIINREKAVGSIVAVLTPQDQTPVEKISAEIIAFKQKSAKDILAGFIGGERVKEAITAMRANCIPNFSFPDQGIVVLNKYYQWNNFKNKAEEKTDKTNEKRAEKTRAIVEKVVADGRNALLFSEAREVLELYEINTVGQSVRAGEKISPPYPFPVVVKVDSDKVLHKTDKQGVILNIKNEQEFAAALSKMGANFPGENILIQPMLEKQTELILGIKNDPVAGPIIVYGLGGIYTEIFKLVDFLIPPLTISEITESLAKSKIAFLFKETRGQNAYATEELAKILRGLSALAEEVIAIKELDINPLLIYNDGKRSVAVDVKIII